MDDDGGDEEELAADVDQPKVGRTNLEHGTCVAACSSGRKSPHDKGNQSLLYLI